MNLSLLGNIGLGVAFICAGAQSSVLIWSRSLERRAKMSIIISSLLFIFMTLSFVSLLAAYIISDFSLVTVALHSSQSQPLIYKIAGVWGNHEGSLLLWGVISTLLPVLFSFFCIQLDRRGYVETLVYMGWINLAFILYVTVSSNPFMAMGHGVMEGKGMNPLLQDPSMAIHPPLLYIGYVGFSLPFAMTLAALHHNLLIPSWIKNIRLWVLIAWSFLTMGVALGSFWAYYELGWGGWWFWDPVENASLMPWCLGVALIHALAIAHKRSSHMKLSVILVYATFLFCLLGAFLTRSGLLTSVHSFATSPQRGLPILGFAGVISLVFAYRFVKASYKSHKTNSVFFLSKQSFMILGITLLLIIMAIIAFGTFYPFFSTKIESYEATLGTSFFTKTVVPMTIPLLILMGAAPLLTESKSSLSAAFKRLQFPIFGALLGLFLSLFVYDQKSFYAAIFIAFALFLIGSVVMTWKSRGFKMELSRYGMDLAHLGVALCLLGMTVDTYNTTETTQVMQPGETGTFGDYSFTLESVTYKEESNYRRETATLIITKKRAPVAILYPEKRLYRVEKSLTSEVALKQTATAQFYAVLGDYREKAAWVIRLYYRPLVHLIWIGAFLMAFGGLASLFLRKNRKKI